MPHDILFRLGGCSQHQLIHVDMNGLRLWLGSGVLLLTHRRCRTVRIPTTRPSTPTRYKGQSRAPAFSHHHLKRHTSSIPQICTRKHSSADFSDYGIMIPRSARRGSLFFLLFVIIVVAVLLHRSRYLLGLLYEDGSRDAIDVSSMEVVGNGTLLIPKIIHQTYKTEDIPAHWREGQRVLKELHQDWEYMVRRSLSRLLPKILQRERS